jgi:hypothetical protein
VIGRLVGTHVQRLATIAHGDGICTTHIPGPLQRPAADHTPPGNRSPAPGPVPSRSHPSSTTPTHRERTPA